MIGLVLVIALAACSGGNVLSLGDGDCFDDGDLSAEVITEVPIVDCADPHDNEVYEVIPLSGSTYPGEEQLGLQADEECLSAFEPFVGEPYETSTLDFGWLTPTPESWDGGDREIACFLYRTDLAKMSGTMENSGL